MLASNEPRRPTRVRTDFDELFVRTARCTRLRCRSYGPAEALPLLLVRPLGGAITLWEGLLAALHPSLRVITFDPAGVGGSTGAARMTVHGLARDALAVLDAWKIRHAAVLGQSLGGFVALHLAAHWPERVRGLVLASTALSGSSFGRPPLRRGIASARCFLARRGEVEVCMLQHTLRRDFMERVPTEVRFIEACLRAEPTSRRTLLSHDVAAALYRGRRDAARVRCSRVLLAGGADDLLGVAPQQELARALSGELVVLRGVGHDLSLEAPDELARVVNASLLPGETA